MAGFAPDPQRGGTTGGGTTTGGGATTGGGTAGGGGRPSGGAGVNTGTGGTTRTGAGNTGNTGRNPTNGVNNGNTGNIGNRGGGNPTMMPGQYSNNPFGAGRNIVPAFPPFAGDNQQALYMLADGTGGFVILNTNDLLGGLQKIGKEQNEYYLIGYAPSETPEGSCHTLKVKVDKGYQVRARSGYCNVKQVDLLAGKPAKKISKIA